MTLQICIMHKAVIILSSFLLPMQFCTALVLINEKCGESQQWSRLVLLKGFRASGLVLCCRLDKTDLLDLRVEKMNVRKVGTICNCLNASLLLPTSRTSTRNRQFEPSDACRASSLPAPPRFQPGATAALLLAANDGSSTRWQCSSGIFGSAEAAPVLTQQDLNTTKAHLNSKKKSLGRKSRD